jgi:hypothetical protein
MSVQENVIKYKETLNAVKSHHMCLKFTEDKTHFLIYFPAGFQLDGVRVSKGLGKTVALEKALEKMELCWKGI